jgi:hypothetical protein
MMAREGTPVIEPIRQFSRDGQPFAGMTVRMEMQGVQIYQRLESTLCRDYVVTFGLASPSQQSLQSALKSLDTLKFGGCK